GIRNLCFVDFLSGFQRPSVTALRTTNCLPPPSLAGRASYRCPRLVSKGFASALVHAPLLQGARHVTPCSGGVKNLLRDPSPFAGTLGCRRRFLASPGLAAGEVHLLAAARDARFRAHHTHYLKRAPQRAQERFEFAAHEELHDEGARGLEHLERERERAPRELERSGFVRAAHPGGLRRKIAEHRIVGSVPFSAQALDERGSERIRNPRAGGRRQWRNRFEIDSQDEALRADFARGDLAPASGRCPQIEHTPSRPQHVEALLDLLQLEGRAGAQALLLGLPPEAISRVVRAGHRAFS